MSLGWGMAKFLITFVLLFFGADSIASVGENKQFLIQEASHYLRSLPDINNDSQIKIAIPHLGTTNHGCQDLKFSVISRNHQSGYFKLGVLCRDSESWHSTFNAYVINPRNYFLAAHTLDEGQIIKDSDISVLHDFKAATPTAIVSKKQQILGYTVARPIEKGKVFQRADLKLTKNLARGQTIKIISRGNGFLISNQGTLLNSPRNGQSARVETASKQVLTGIVEGAVVVEIVN